ncbi:MAG TPA: tRNA pseudouridine(38-40) synthase TruA [Candidatus Limnocylindrales bacterium]|nr:tRNA pseudouridine(38-40) synthase TruA [Candidatus Limnocylindrales bacterium]
MKINTLIHITYDGTNLSGFQFQKNAFTVQEAIEHALSIIYKERVSIIGAGRTDAGVHARGQVANFMAPFFISPENLPHAVNSLLPSEIVVVGAEEVPEKFHARHDARRKIYSYTLDRAAFPQVMKRRYSLHVPESLDLDYMQKAGHLFEGTHNFKAFRSVGSPVTNTERTLYRVMLFDKLDEQLVQLHFEGDGFLYRMIRLITGTLIRAGKGVLTLDEIEGALNGSIEGVAGPTAPAHGLCLERVIYQA